MKQKLMIRMASAAVSAVLAAGSVSPAFAAALKTPPLSPYFADWDIGKSPRISKDTIDRTKKGSITIYKMDEENGNTSEGDGMYHSAENDAYGEDNITTERNVILDSQGNPAGEEREVTARDGVPNIIFSEVKIADIVNAAGKNDATGNQEVGMYYANLDSGFREMAEDCGVNVDSYATTVNGRKYWSTEQMEAILEKLKDTDGDGSTWTGETRVNAYVEKAAKAGKGRDFTATGAQLSDDKKAMYYDGKDKDPNQDKGKTVMTGLDLGLYLIAETGYYDKDEDGSYQKVYRDYVYDSDGHESANRKTQKNKQANSTDRETKYPDQTKVSHKDNNYNDDTDVEGDLNHSNKHGFPAAQGKKEGEIRDNVQARNSKEQRYSDTDDDGSPNYGNGNFEDAEDGTQNPYVIDTPSSPFFVSLPQTNAADLSQDGVTYKAGTVWQYDLNVYPKNNMTSITKKAVMDDGDTLTERQDYHIGQTIHQVIYADSPVTMYTKEENDARRNKVYKISDTMSKGLTFQKVTRVALRGRIADPQKLSQFDQKDTDAENYRKYGTDTEFDRKDYRIIYTLNDGTTMTENRKYYGDEDGKVPGYTVADAPDDSAQGERTGGIVANGNEYIQSFTVELTESGLKKLDHQKVSSQVIVEFDSVLNKNAVIGSEDGMTFNTNRPTLTWRNQSGLERKIEGNPVHIFTYQLNLTKSGESSKGRKDINGKTVSDDHIFDAGDVSFTVQQSRQYDPDLENNKAFVTENAYLLFVQDRDSAGHAIDGSYHVYTPADGAIEGIITAETLKKESHGTSRADDGQKEDKDNYRKNKDGSSLEEKDSSFDRKFKEAEEGADGFKTVDQVRYNSSRYAVTELTGNEALVKKLCSTYAHAYGFVEDTAGNKTVLKTTEAAPAKTCVVTQLVSPAHTDTKIGSGRQSGLLSIRGLDSMLYTITEKSTSSHFNLLKDRFLVELNATRPQDGNLVKNKDSSGKVRTQSTESPANAGGITKQNVVFEPFYQVHEPNYGACLITDTGTALKTETSVIPLSHKNGIVSVTVQNYKTITLHTGGSGTWYFYLLAAVLAGGAVTLVITNKKRKTPAV